MTATKRAMAIVAFALLAAACNGGSDPPPTLATGTTAPPTTTTTSTTTTTTTTTTVAPTTTQGADARLAEIEAAASRALVTWLRALYHKDKELLFSVAGSQAVYESGIEAIDGGTVTFVSEPTQGNTFVTVTEVVLDRDDCVAAQIEQITDTVAIAIEPIVQVWFPQEDGSFKVARNWGAGTSAQTLEPDCDLIIREFQP